MNAFLPALAAESRVNQKAISQYEQAPTPSQPTKVINMFDPSTRMSIEATNRFMYKKNLG